MEQKKGTFPFQELMDGSMQGWSVERLLEAAGEPLNREGPVWVYDIDRKDMVEPNVLGDPKRVYVTLWIAEDTVSSAWVSLTFNDGLKYQEVTF